MKVFFVASVYRHFKSFHIPYMKYLQSKGYEVWAAGAKNDQVKLQLIELGFTCVDIPISRHPFDKKNIDAYRNLKTLFMRENFELVHVHTPITALLTRLAFRSSKGGKLIYTAHGFHFFKGGSILNWLIYYPLERIASRWTDLLITINNEDYKRALKMGFRNGAVRYVHGVGVETGSISLTDEDKKSIKQSLDLKEDSVVISYIAELNKNKNQQFLMRNWKQIKHQVPNAVLLLIGEGQMRVDFEKKIIEEKLNDIFVLGYRNDVDSILGITDVVSLLSHREGLPKSIMEAMANSLPCVVTNTRGLRDLINQEQNGYVVNLGDDEMLVSSFVKLLSDDDLRKRMGEVALEKVEPYLLDNVLKEYIEIYNEVLGKE